MDTVAIGKGVQINRSKNNGIAILNFGTRLQAVKEAARELDASICDMRWVKPIDEELVLKMAEQHQMLVTVEENAIAGGAGSAVTEFLNSKGVNIPVLQLGLDDRYVEHGKPQQLLQVEQLDTEGIRQSIEQRWAELNHKEQHDNKPRNLA